MKIKETAKCLSELGARLFLCFDILKGSQGRRNAGRIAGGQKRSAVVTAQF